MEQTSVFAGIQPNGVLGFIAAQCVAAIVAIILFGLFRDKELSK